MRSDSRCPFPRKQPQLPPERSCPVSSKPKADGITTPRQDAGPFGVFRRTGCADAGCAQLSPDPFSQSGRPLMARSEAQTRFELIDPALEGRGWNRRTDIRVVETAKPIDIVNHQPCERTRKPLASAGSYKINLVNLSSVQVPAAPIGQQAHTAAACPTISRPRSRRNAFTFSRRCPAKVPWAWKCPMR